MAWPNPVLWFDVLGGANAQHVDKLRQDPELLEFVQAQDVIPDPPGKLVTRPGFSKVRASAISGTPAITGMFHMGDVADKFIIGASDGELYQDDASPPSNLASGTDFTTGNTNLLRGDVGSDVLVVVSQSRDTPQQVNASATRSDLAGTPPKGIDFKWFGRRPWMFSPNVGGTVYDDFAIFGSTDDSVSAWTNPTTKNFLNFGRPGAKDSVLGGEVYMDTLCAFTKDNLYPIYQTPQSELPFSFQAPIFSEPGGGPPNIHSVVKADGRLWWISQNYDVKMMQGTQVKSIGFPMHPFLRGLSDSRRIYTIGGWEPRYRLALWAISDSGDSTNKDVLALHVDTMQFYLLALSRNAFANRVVSGQLRLVGGGYAGLFYNEFDTSTTGSLDDATAVINADVITPRFHLGLPGVLKKCPYVVIEFDPISTEVLTIQYRLNDDTSWTSFSESTYTMSGTDTKRGYFTIPGPFERIQLRILDNNSGERYRASRIGFPQPTAIRVSR